MRAFEEVQQVFGKVVEDSRSTLEEVVEQYDDDMYETASDCFNDNPEIDSFRLELRKVYPQATDEQVSDLFSRFSSLVTSFKEKVGLSG